MPGRTSVTLHHVEEGAGVPVLAVHGWTPDHRLMTGCLEPLFRQRPGFRRLYPDLPGMGASPAPASIASSDDVLAALLDFVDDRIGTEPFLLVGESYGGYLARAIIRDRPGQVLGLALICPIGVGSIGNPAPRVPTQQVLRPDPELLAGIDDEHVTQAYVPMAVVQSPATFERFLTEVLPGLDLADHAALDRIFQRWSLSDDPDVGEPFGRPSLVLTGRQDHVVGYLDQLALLDLYPRATFAILDVAGHNAQVEQPILFEALIHEWLDRVTAEA